MLSPTKPSLHLAAVLLASAASLAQQPKITFADPPAPPPAFGGGLSTEALYPPEARATTTGGTFQKGPFAALVDHKISAIQITWSDANSFPSRQQTQDLLLNLLTSTKTDIYSFHVWSFMDGRPCLTATIDHVTGAPGRMVLWCFEGMAYWAYQAGDGRWWWASTSFQSPPPRGQRTPESPRLEAMLKSLPATIPGLTLPSSPSVLTNENQVSAQYDNGIGIRISTYDSPKAVAAAMQTSVDSTSIAPTDKQIAEDTTTYKWDQWGSYRILTNVGLYIVNIEAIQQEKQTADKALATITSQLSTQ